MDTAAWKTCMLVLWKGKFTVWLSCIIYMQKFQQTHCLRAPNNIIYPKQCRKLNFFQCKEKLNWVQKVEIKLIVSLRSVKGLSVERQLRYVFFFSVRMKNVQTDLNHKPCNHKAILCFYPSILTCLNFEQSWSRLSFVGREQGAMWVYYLVY